MRRWLYLLIPLLIVLLVVWRLGEKVMEKRAQEQQRLARLKAPPIISVSPVDQRIILRTFETTGSAQAPIDVNIASKVVGKITYLQVREGARIHKGEVLAKVDNLDILAQVRQAQHAVDESSQRLSQAQLIQSPTNVNVDTQIREQKAAVTGSEADYDQAQKNYSRQVSAAQQAVKDAQHRVKGAKAAAAGAKANYVDAKAKYDRYYELYKQGFVAAQDAEDARAQEEIQRNVADTANESLNSDLAQLQAAEDQLEITKKTGEANIVDTRSKLVQARNALAYAKSNINQKPAYAHNLAAMRQAVIEARQNLKSLESRLADTVLTSPVDGFVTTRYLDPGAVVIAGQQILAVAYVRDVWVNIFVPEEVSAQVAVGQAATLTFDALPGRKFAGSVALYTPAADPTSRQFMARIAFANPGAVVKPGSYSRVSIVTQRIVSPAAVPREAILTDKSGPYVMVVTDGKAYRRPVVTGVFDPDFIAINKGLRRGEQVVVSTAYPLRNGQKVKIGSVKVRSAQRFREKGFAMQGDSARRV